MAHSSWHFSSCKETSSRSPPLQKASNRVLIVETSKTKLAYHWCFKDTCVMHDCPNLIVELNQHANDHKNKASTVANAATFSNSREEFQDADNALEEELENNCNLDQIEAHLASSWYIDSGASKHIVGDLAAFENFCLVDSYSSIKIAGKKVYPIVGIGEASVSATKGEIKFQKVLYVLGVKKIFY